MNGRNGPSDPIIDLLALRRAVQARDEWLDHGLSTAPADRATAEHAISGLYRLLNREPPRFTWVDSPGAMLAPDPPVAPVVPGPWLRDALALDPDPDTAPPVAAQLATLVSSLRRTLDRRIDQRFKLWASRFSARDSAAARLQPPEAALRDGVNGVLLLKTTVDESLHGSLHDAVRAPLRRAFAQQGGGPSDLAWFGQHDAHWVARYDVVDRLGLLPISGAERYQLDLWCALARSCGWWWPGEDVCVISERPTALHYEPVPNDAHGGVRLHRDHGPAVVFADGWCVHALHGTHVPAWVVSVPTVERITAERNVEVRRTAIERIGWDAYIDRAGLRLAAEAPDPGNPGFSLRLYDSPSEEWGTPTRVLLAVNGSVERDGRRRKYGLTVPASFDDPVAAAGWSYGLTGTLYARLARRT
ncbi:hypothetical protein CLV63_12816 [Murinocardiopsis flavida]|uniref:DUF6745 domain-containing protein n=1 Tax=Murinocardiopsis flavida TaxID=645275 RepID=A0A2P8CVD5_9ACTN|nr:hypothetical protein [Murinocardiopsis flavida]PSK88928.1 hypothetical protein CLV63_12816 [Murinocardiopsis flavida]